MIFEQDLRNEIARIACVLGFKLNMDKRWDKLLLDFLTVRYKIINVKPRKVLVNPEFKKGLSQHPKSLEIGIILEYAKRGENLNYLQSKKLIQSNFHDHLQSEWQIHHFHLSFQRSGSRTFVKQVNNLLFAYIDDNHFVVLGTSKHEPGVFGDTKWIKVLHDHFPNLIDEFKGQTFENFWPKLTAIERQTLWNKGYSFGITQIGESLYRNPGVGRTTSGHSLSVVKSCNAFIRWLLSVSEQVSKYHNEILEFLMLKSSNAEFKIRISITIELFEVNSNKLILTYPELFNVESWPKHGI